MSDELRKRENQVFEMKNDQILQKVQDFTNIQAKIQNQNEQIKQI